MTDVDLFEDGATPVHSITVDEETYLTHKSLLLEDPWIFGKAICGLNALVERHHRPIIYLMTGKVDLLLGMLCNPMMESEVLRQIRAQLRRKGLSAFRPGDRDAIRDFILMLNIRMARGTYKTSCEIVAISYLITADPNECIALFGLSDPTATEICNTVGEIVRSETYGEWFPERVPDEPRKDITGEAIMLKGRTRTEFKEPCLLAKGHRSDWTSRHFTRMFFDDVVGKENSSHRELAITLARLANFEGLKMNPAVWPEVPEVHVGTIWSRFDDSADLEEDEDCLTIKIPIERRADGKPWTMQNYLEAGIPTMPEVLDAAQVQKKKHRVRKHKEEGVNAWFCNFLLIAFEDGATVFHPDVVDNAKFSWRVNIRTGVREVSRLATKPDRTPVVDAQGKQLAFYFDPRRMKKVLAVDQARSVRASGNEWAIACVAIDHQGVRMVLEVIAGRGYNMMLTTLVEMDERWNPFEIAVEGGTMQGITVDWLRRSEEFQSLAGRVVEISNWLRKKVDRIRQHVAAALESGELLLNPEDLKTTREMKQYNPFEADPKDNRIDAIAMASDRLDTPGEVSTEAEDQLAERKAAVARKTAKDDDTGIDVYNWYEGKEDSYAA